MEVLNEIWKKILVWNGRFLAWNGNRMEEYCQYGIWKNHLPFHTMPCMSKQMNSSGTPVENNCSRQNVVLIFFMHTIAKLYPKSLAVKYKHNYSLVYLTNPG